MKVEKPEFLDGIPSGLTPIDLVEAYKPRICVEVKSVHEIMLHVGSGTQTTNPKGLKQLAVHLYHLALYLEQNS